MRWVSRTTWSATCTGASSVGSCQGEEGSIASASTTASRSHRLTESSCSRPSCRILGTVADREVSEAVARSFLGRLPADLDDALVEVGERTDYPAGSTLYREGSYPRALLVVRGLLRVHMTSPEGRQVTVRYARACDVLGIAVLVGGPAD